MAMSREFRNLIEVLDPLYRQLMHSDPVRPESLPRVMPESGIYLFSEKGKHLYVGRTNRIRKRIQEHCRPSSRHNSAPFAFALARRATRRLHASYTVAGSRKELERNPRFRTAFSNAKARVQKMDVRFVQEADPTRQALLELYVAIALGTPFNDFNTH